jgi:hypothetical protein
MPLWRLESSQVSTTIDGDGKSVGSAHPPEASIQGIRLEGQTITAPPIMYISESLNGAAYRSLGPLARNAFFSDTVEVLVWPLEVLDKSESHPWTRLWLNISSHCRQSSRELRERTVPQPVIS